MILISTIILFLVSLSFSTVFERKILSIYNFRFGPIKSFTGGILIPFRDFLKLFRKFFKIIFFVDFLYFKIFLGLIIFLLFLNFYPLFNSIFSFLFCLILIFLIYSIIIYYIFFLGWRSKRKYAYISSFRILIQSIRYEVGFIFSFLLLIFLWREFDLFNLFRNGKNFLLNLVFSSIWLIFIFREIGRRPFDFVEGESELVRGFNIEYLGGIFSIIFIIEYGLIILIRIIFSFLIMGSNFFFIFIFFLICFIRCCFPRLRYDKIIYIFWKDYLFFIILIFIYFNFFF